MPEEDMGYFMTSVQLSTGASLNRTDSVMRSITAEIKELPQVKDVISVAGQSFLAGGASSNLGSMFVVLKPWKERKGKDNTVEAVMAKAEEIGSRCQEAIVFSVNPPSIPGLGMSSGLQMQILDINNLGPKELAQAVAEIQA
ncbi:MAG: efflux RND transporter permease subunit, partial [Muribaculaceae bacterium]|nr:efflux RND transporter permease subunit [Muribaculaceae bacterium]